MPYVKITKSKAYQSRFTTKFRRRREGKTDYAARKGLVVQDKNKYQIPKHRLVARITNKYVIAQIVRTGVKGDLTVCQANSRELSRYGLTVGLKNYAACYATGLLLARRLLSSLTGDVVDEEGNVGFGSLADAYEGNVDITGDTVKFTADEAMHAGQRKKRTYWVDQDQYYAEMDRYDFDDHVRRPFRAFLDVGIKVTSPGARVFGVLKGAVDGGMDIPHNEKNFPGYNAKAEEEDEKWEPEEHRRRIMGECVGEWIQLVAAGHLAGGDGKKARNAQQFSQFKAAGLDSEESYAAKLEAVHAAIRADPSPAAKMPFTATADLKAKLRKTPKKAGDLRRAEVAQRWETYQANRQAAMAARVQELLAAVGGDADEDSDEE